MQAAPGVVTFLFTDIEGSSRLWEQEPARMRETMERHDAIVRAAVAEHRGRVVKMLGDGVHAAFDDPLDAVAAVIAIQRALADAAATGGIALAVRSGLHAGVEQERDDDYFGRAVNRAARIMRVAHGGQIIASQAVAALVAPRLPAGVVLRDLGEVRLRDLASAERVYQVVHPALRAEFPALRALTATPNNLPHQLTSFVGREREVEEVAQLLAKNRLVTLTGVGGIGKTRLSLQVAAGLLDDFPDGVWLVELASLADARLVPEAVASVVGVKEEAGRPLTEALAQIREGAAPAARSRQLRAPAAGMRGACGPAPESGGAGADPRVEPGTVAYPRRGDLPGAAAARARSVPDLHARYGKAIWGGAAVRRARGGGATGFRGD